MDENMNAVGVKENDAADTDLSQFDAGSPDVDLSAFGTDISDEEMSQFDAKAEMSMENDKLVLAQSDRDLEGFAGLFPNDWELRYPDGWIEKAKEAKKIPVR